MDNSEEGGISVESTRSTQSTRWNTISSVKIERRVVVVGDLLLRGTKGPVCQPDPSHRDVCCLPRASIRDTSSRFPGVLWPTDYYSMLVVHVSSDEDDKRNTGVI